MSDSAREFERLLSAVADGSLDAVGRDRLNALIREDATRADAYLDHLAAHAMLRREFGSERSVMLEQPTVTEEAHVEAADVSPVAKVGTPRVRRFAYGVAAALVMAGAAAAAYFAVAAMQPEPTPAPGPIVATLIDAQDARWNTEPVSPGMPIRRGVLELAAGRIELQTLSGVSVMIEAPTRVRFDSAQAAALEYGNVAARVPEGAIGFKVATPGVGVVDLGTEFDVRVDGEGWTEVRVYDGSVRLDYRGGGSRVVTAGSGMAVGADGASREIAGPIQRYTFIEDREIAAERWLRMSNKLTEDPALVAHYRFDDSLRGDRLVNSVDPTGGLNGRITGAAIEPGRHVNKKSLRFHGEGSEDRIVIGETSSPGTPLDEQAWGDTFKGGYTVAVWFKVNELDKVYNTLAVQEGRNWRLVRNHSKRALTFNTGHPEPHHSLNGSTPIDDGRWHLAVITQEPAPGSGMTKCLYIDGKLEAKHTTWWRPKPNGLPIYVGYNDAVPGLGGNVFNGWIDELIVFRKAITPKRIKEIYELGKPLEESSQGKETEQ